MDDERHGEGQFTFSTREVYEGRWIEDRISESKIIFNNEKKPVFFNLSFSFKDHEARLPWVCCVTLPCCLFDLACLFLPSFFISH